MNGGRQVYVSRGVNYGLRSPILQPKRGPIFGGTRRTGFSNFQQASEFSGNMKGATRRPKATICVEDLPLLEILALERICRSSVSLVYY